MSEQNFSTIRTRIAQRMAKLTNSEVGYINRIRQIYLDVEEDIRLPLALRDEITEYLFNVVDALLKHVGERQ